MNIIVALFNVAIYLLEALWWIIIIQVVLSWLFAFNVLNASSQAVRTVANALDRITAPIYRPIRKLLPDFGGLDLSPIVVLLVIKVLQMLLDGAAKDIASASV